MKTWRVNASVVAGKHIGTFKAKTGEAACDKAERGGRCDVRVCHYCANEVSDPEVSALSAECVETGEVYRQPELGVSSAKRELAEALRAKLMERRQRHGSLLVGVDCTGDEAKGYRRGVIAGLDLALQVLAEVCGE